MSYFINERRVSLDPSSGSGSLSRMHSLGIPSAGAALHSLVNDKGMLRGVFRTAVNHIPSLKGLNMGCASWKSGASNASR